MAADDVSQVAQYTGNLACQGQFVKSNMAFAFLIDEEFYRIGFSPFSHSNLVLPIVVFSPPIRWRTGTTLEEGACVALCLLQHLVLARIEVSKDQLACLMPTDIMAIAGEIETEHQLEVEEEDGILQEYALELEKLRNEVDELKDEVTELRRKIANLENAQSPGHTESAKKKQITSHSDHTTPRSSKFLKKRPHD